MYGKKSVLGVLLFFFLGSSFLQARSPSAAQIWENALNADDDSDFVTVKKKKKYKYKRRSKSKKSKKSGKSIKVKKIILSDQKKLQTSLVALGFYHGPINGEVNADETRQAISAMNQAYRDKNTTFLDKDVKEGLIYLADLHQYKQYLNTKKKDKKTNAQKLQTALKIFGYYDGEIDGVTGSGTRKSVEKYKMDNNLSQGNTLDFEEEYQLIIKAIASNDRNIQETKDKLYISRNKNTEESSLTLPVVNEEAQIKSKKDPMDNNLSESQDIINSEPIDSGVTLEECKMLATSFDDTVLEGNKEKLDDLESTANILLYMCHIKKTKTGDIEQTIKRLKDN